MACLGIYGQLVPAVRIKKKTNSMDREAKLHKISI
jgi:hypothetical protein